MATTACCSLVTLENEVSVESVTSIAFVPSHIEGVEKAEHVTVFPDRLEISTEGGLLSYRFSDISQPQEARWWSAFKRLFGVAPWNEIVADRNWFKNPKDRYFKFFTEPQIKVCMPEDELENHQKSYFWRIQLVMGSGGYGSYDLG